MGIFIVVCTYCHPCCGLSSSFMDKNKCFDSRTHTHSHTVMAYMEMFGNCSHAAHGNSEFVRHSMHTCNLNHHSASVDHLTATTTMAAASSTAINTTTTTTTSQQINNRYTQLSHSQTMR